MRNTIRFFGIIALVAVIGFSFITCDNGDGGGGGIQGGAPAITTATLPNGAVGTTYSQTLEAGGDTPITWRLDSGALPAGLNLYEGGVIYGTPTAAGTSTFIVKAINAAGSGTKPLSVTITGDSGPPILDGTWYSYGNVLKYQFNNGSFEHYNNANPDKKGTYTTTNDSMTMTITHLGSRNLSSFDTYVNLSSEEWYSRNTVRTSYINYQRAVYREMIQGVWDQFSGLSFMTPSDAFMTMYGTTNFETIMYEHYNFADVEVAMDSYLDSLYTTSTVAYSLSVDRLILGGTTYTR
jgi:hypothetical protein